MVGEFYLIKGELLYLFIYIFIYLFILFYFILFYLFTGFFLLTEGFDFRYCIQPTLLATSFRKSFFTKRFTHKW